MSFGLDWLDLREPADSAARDRDLLARAQAHLAGGEDPVAVDLGAGSGATVRAFAGGPRARWRLVDNDPLLLDAAMKRGGAEIAVFRMDLRRLDTLPLAGARLVTASALLDLASAAWIEALAARIADAGAGLYAALNYDGRARFEPADTQDAAILAAFNRHQRRDKGFGPALGPRAGPCLAQAMREAGYRVRTAESPWRLGPAQRTLQRATLAGMAAAASEAGEAGTQAWLERRLAALSCGTLFIGHTDILALPAS